MNRKKLKDNFEKELKEKVFMNTNSNSCDSETLLKFFRYYDIYNNGLCTLDNFKKTIRRIGIKNFSDEQLEIIFYLYNIRIDSKLNYCEFVEKLYNIIPKKNISSLMLNRQINNVPSNLKVNPYVNIIEKMKNELMKRGIRGFFDLYKFSFENNRINIYDMIKLKQNLKLNLNDDEIKELFNDIDYIDYEQLKKNIRGNLSNNRKLIVETIYENILKKYNGKITLSLLFNIYNPKNHPDVFRNLINENIIYYEFCDTFHILHHYYYNLMINQMENTIPIEQFDISLNEFIEYYENISPFINDEKLFSNILIDCFTQNNINYENYYQNNNSYNKSPVNNSISQNPNNYNQKIEKINPIEKLKIILKSRGSRGLMSLKRSLILSDDKNNKRVSLNKFKSICNDYRFDLSNEEINYIYLKYCFTCNKGFIEYEDLINDIIGKLNKKRIEIIKFTFENLLRYDTKTYVRLEDIKKKFNPKGHPDYINNKRDEDEILAEFLDYFQYHFQLFNETQQDLITYSQFLNFYKYISFDIENDDYFEKMMKGVWNLPKKKFH